MSLARVRSLVILGVLVLVAVIVVTWTIMSDNQGTTTTARHCGPNEKRASTRIPKEQDVKLNVYNSTDRNGLAGQTAHELRGVKFQVISVKQDPKGAVIHGSAQIRFGRKEVGAAQLLRAYVPGAKTAFDPNRDDDTIDLVLGQKYQDIRGPTDVKQAEVNLGDPSPPPGTC